VRRPGAAHYDFRANHKLQILALPGRRRAADERLHIGRIGKESPGGLGPKSKETGNGNRNAAGPRIENARNDGIILLQIGWFASADFNSVEAPLFRGGILPIFDPLEAAFVTECESTALHKPNRPIVIEGPD
jgi:hypothetical protein